MRAKCILNMYVFGFYFNHVLHTPHSQLHVVACVLFVVWLQISAVFY